MRYTLEQIAEAQRIVRAAHQECPWVEAVVLPAKRRKIRHRWWTRMTYSGEIQDVPCRCGRWQRLWFMLTGR
jgi:hypothetical protein